MVGTREGGLKASKTNKAKYGEDFYKKNGAKGGRNGHTGGFASNPALARIAEAKGGRISRRGPAKNNTKPTPKFKVAKPEINPEPKPGIFKRLFKGAK